jgi:uncharacterized LabA/DUF88 family protein
MAKERENNEAFIDGQNLHLGTRVSGFSVDHKKFRTYLRDKYNVVTAYYFMGTSTAKENDMYTALQKAGFIIQFREHSAHMEGKKKGNVDSDIVFSIMSKIADGESIGKVILVSGDGDYKRMVDWLIKKGLFKKILFPNRRYASSLYGKLGSEYHDSLDTKGIREKIEFIKGERPK